MNATTRRRPKAGTTWHEGALPLIIFMALVVLLGGSARADIATLIVLRPLTVLAAGFALYRLARADWQANRGPLAILFLALGLAAVQLVPLPSAVWSALPGRGVVAAIDQAAGLGDVWRPLTLDPAMTANALWSLFAPLAAFALAVRHDLVTDRTVQRALLALGLLSGLLGVLQFAGGPSSPFYYYRVTNNGSAVGFFANRNHQAVFLATLLPLIAAYVSRILRAPVRRRHDRSDERKWPVIGAAGAAAMLVPMILATGSRAGLVGLALGFAASLALLWRPVQPAETGVAKPRNAGLARWARPAAALLGALFIGAMLALVGMQQDNSVSRALGQDQEDAELRWPLWRIASDLAGDGMPLGYGLGSFVRVFQVHEPGEFLSTYYVNHAHNDYLEVAMDSGLPGALLLAALVMLVAWRALRAWRRPATENAQVNARAASAALLILALASAVDYPVRTPLMACWTALLVAMVWAGTRTAGRAGAVR